MNEANLLIVRHPETEANIDGRLVGRGESPLTPQGMLQLRRVPAKVAAFKPDAVWSSPLERALRLAQRSAAESDCPLRVDDRLTELDFGDAEGLTFEEIDELGLAFDYRNHDAPVAPNGESRADIERRSAEIADEIVAQGGRAAIITHGGVFRASLVHLLGLCSADIWAFHIKNAQIAHVRVVDGHGWMESFFEG